MKGGFLFLGGGGEFYSFGGGGEFYYYGGKFIGWGGGGGELPPPSHQNYLPAPMIQWWPSRRKSTFLCALSSQSGFICFSVWVRWDERAIVLL